MESYFAQAPERPATMSVGQSPEEKTLLPHPVPYYLKHLRTTVESTCAWLRGVWQLRTCTSVGPWSRVVGRVRIHNEGSIIIGARVRFYSRYAPSLVSAIGTGRVQIGEETFINYGADIAATSLVQIGQQCLIGTYCMILDNSFHDLQDRNKVPVGQPVIIGDRVWLGNRVIILPGVRIGDDAVVGAGSVVTKDVEARTVVAGNPARVIRRLD